jgi:hypothetical protein
LHERNAYASAVATGLEMNDDQNQVPAITIAIQWFLAMQKLARKTSFLKLINRVVSFCTAQS